MEAKSKFKANSNKLIETKDLIFVWRLLVKNIVYLILIPIISYTVGYLYSYRLSNIYGLKAQFLLKSGDTYDYQDPIYRGLGAYGAYMDVQNQMRILKSRDLIGEVIDKINVNTSYYVVGRIKRHEVFETLPFKSSVSVLNEGVFEIPIRIVILDEDRYEVLYESDGMEKRFEYFFDQELTTEDFILKLERMYVFNEDNLKIIQSSDYEIVFHSRDFLINKYQQNLEVENIEFTSVLNVVLTDELEERGRMFLDTLSTTYTEFSKRTQLEVNQNTIDNIERQLDTINKFIREKEIELLNYRDQNAILHVDKEEDEFFSEYIVYSKQLRELEERLSSINLLDDYLTKTNDDRILPAFFYIEQNDSYLSETVGKIRTKQLSIEIKQTQESEDNPNMINLRKEIALLRGDVRTYLGNLRVALNDQISTVKKYIDDFREKVKQLPKSSQDILNIQRELDVNTKMYLFLLEKKTNTLIARAGIIPQVRVIESTTRLGVIEPDKNKIKRLFFLGGVILALFIAVVRKLFFEKIESVQELSEVTQMGVMGGVSLIKKIEDPLPVMSSPKSQITEEFRKIRTNLSYLNSEPGGARKILVSSFFPGEGKTFCSSNLSVLMARSEKKVLVIDLDLHRPKIHKVFALQNQVGVSSYIIEKATIDEIVIANVVPNLDIITAGPISPNPSELMLRQRLKDLINWANKNYDYVIIDTPPFGLLNDTMELAALVDVFLVILNAKYTSKRGLGNLEEILSNLEGVSVGCVLNGISMKRLQYYYTKYSYRYTYGYGYGYGYNYENKYSSDNYS